MTTSGIYVRAINANGQWDSVDVLDLDDESFRIFILRMLVRGRVPVGIRSELEDMDRLDLKAGPKPA